MKPHKSTAEYQRNRRLVCQRYWVRVVHESGRVRVLKLDFGHDIGRAIDYKAYRAEIAWTDKVVSKTLHASPDGPAIEIPVKKNNEATLCDGSIQI